MSEPSEEWLEQTNARFSAESVPHKQRPWLAWRQWAMESHEPLALSDPPVKRIFSWFKESTKADSQQIGNLYVGAFYYDAEIWPVVVPVFYGTAQLRPLDWLPSMLERVKARLNQDERPWTGFVSAFSDCLDAALLTPRCARDTSLSAFARQLLASGGEALSAAAELLILKTPHPKALGGARTATENFLKAFLAARDGIDEKGAKDVYRHDLPKLMQRALEIAPRSDFAEVAPSLTVLPGVSERYESKGSPILTLWDGYSVALRIAATVLRLLTGEDSRKGTEG